MNDKNQKLVKEALIELLQVMDIAMEIEEERIEDMGDGKESYTINLQTDYPNLLIGQYGSNLQSLQHLTGMIVRKKRVLENIIDDDEIKFNIDVNNYKKQKRESLVKLVDTIANQVLYSKNSVALRPMSSYERKVIHMEISNRENLETESVGDDLNRRVIIKYAEIKF
ncbi:MAG: hypothetical protein KAI67_00275 [Candidatus Pacebacteria bacterium]|nr:hypothetical protein [Candidatus Paceibacterota bacterium]